MLSKPYLIHSEDLTIEDLDLIFNKANEFKSNFDGSLFDDLKNVTVALAFFEPSTRTKLSFELAAKRLSAITLSYDFQMSSQTKGETLVDTLRTMDAMNMQMYVIRHSGSGVPKLLQENTSGIIINAGDGKHDHPTQGLLDALTIKENIKKLDGLKLTIVGDIINSRVARSNLAILDKLGVDISLCGPGTLLPAKEGIWNRNRYEDIDEAIENSEAIMLLRLQKERMEAGLIPSMSEYTAYYGMTKERYEKKPDLWLLHPGPVNYGVELDWEVSLFPKCLIQKQVENGVFIRMAVLSLLSKNINK